MKKLLFFMVFILSIFVFPFTGDVQAATTTIVKQAVGNGNYKCTFKIPVEEKVRILFGEESYGTYKVTLYDKKSKVVAEKTYNFSFGKEKWTKTLSAGTYTLYMRCQDTYGLEDYDVTIIGNSTQYIKASKIKLDKKVIRTTEGKKHQLKATVTPKYYSGTVSWSSSNKKVAIVDKNGKVTTKRMGFATITAKVDGESVNCKVYVDEKTISLAKGSKQTLSLIGTNKKITWSSSNKKIATVNSKGQISALKKGIVKVTASSGGHKYVFTVKVLNPVTARVDYINDTGIYNEVGIKFGNNTKKSIVYITLQIYQYDNRGKKLSSPYSSYYVNDTIAANSADVYEFWCNDDTKKATVKLREVTFSDGSKLKF